jgi:hypothetical protein
MAAVVAPQLAAKFVEHSPWGGDFGHLERERTSVAEDLGAAFLIGFSFELLRLGVTLFIWTR